jgi:hydroxymethylbilane synthase
LTVLRIATRGSALAQWQASYVADRLRTACRIEAELMVVDTTGDRRPDVPVWEMGGQGVFVKEVQAAVLDGRADVAVHSAKDLPSATAPGLTLAAFPVREDPRDALVGGTVAGLAPGALVATGSVRRRAQLAWARPDLRFAGLRGNVPTRLAKVPPGGAVVVAVAALARLGLLDRVTEVLDPSVVLPQVGQGAIAVECRFDDPDVRTALAVIDDAVVRAAVETERSFLARLGGGCDLPVGAYAVVDSAQVSVSGLLASPDGRVLLRDTVSGPVASGPALGASLADTLMTSGEALV